MLETCAFIGTKPKQISYLIIRHSTLTFGVTAFIFIQVLLLPLVQYLVQVFAQVLDLLLWLLLIEESQKYSWQSSEKHIRYLWTLLTICISRNNNRGRRHHLVKLRFTEKQNQCTNFLNKCFLIICLWQDPNINRVLRHHCYPVFFKAQTC